MSALLDSSVLVAALATNDLRHTECLARLLKGGKCICSHALLGIFSTLTGGKLGVRVTADFAVRMLSETVLPRVSVIELSSVEIIQAPGTAQARGVAVAVSMTKCTSLRPERPSPPSSTPSTWTTSCTSAAEMIPKFRCRR